ncbi:CHRD domain-containing protein [Planctomonas psychrotolerans]|uniref:CHRD domain-containing protein n=1 Tax=Planctomonas psychrotolerans TaxID=2528712 RepID=UPI00123C1F00|nr:CHRD domain-containing protein [Planctomonas psychrotolerans]
MSKNHLIRTLTVGGATAAAFTLFAAAPASAETQVQEPETFTSAFTVMASPDEVVNSDGVLTPGQPGAMGQFDFRINSDEEIICYDITLTGVTGDYQSPAKTATHIHEAAAGQSGPPRIAFPNPVDDGTGTRTSSGCLQGPFTTGVTSPAGSDTGEGFSLAQIEANPAGFVGDAHTVEFVAGAVRGQLSQVPVGGVDTGAGGLAATGTGSEVSGVLGAGALAAAGAAGVVLLRRRRVEES